jgi:hypothetical protein
MKTTDFNPTISANRLNENMFKKFGVKVDFEKYTREELENYRNLLRTKISHHESKANFNELLTNEAYQKDKHLVGLLNQKIKEMLGESKKGDGNLANNAKPYDKVTRGDVIAGRLGKDEKGGKKEKKVKETSHQAKVTMKHVDASNASPKVKAAIGKAAKDIKPGIPGIRDRFDALDAAGIKRDESVEEGFPTVDDAKKAAAGTANMKPGEKKKSSTGGEITKTATGLKHTAGKNYGGQDAPKAPDSDKKFKKVKEATKNLPGNQEKIDADHDGKIEKSDFAKLRAGKKKNMKESQHKQNIKIVNESLRHLINEDEEGKAKTITAGADMVNDFTSWMTRVGQYQTKSMIELADAIRANFGQGEAEQFKGAVAPALETALNTLTQCREEISNAVAVLAGEASPMDAMGGMDGGMEPGMDSMNAGNEEVPMGDEFGASDAASGGAEISGRMRRENREVFARKLSEAHMILSKLSK